MSDLVHIHVLNHEQDAVDSATLDAVCAAVERQVAEDFGPIWDVAATVRRVRHPRDVPPGGYLALVQRSIDVQGAAAYHTLLGRRPEIVVSEEVALACGLTLGEVLSHEVLEALGDPLCAALVADAAGRKWVQEVCDPVQAGSYEVDGVRVSDFVYPSWFTSGSSGPFSYLETLDHDHQVDLGGYAQYVVGGKVHQVLGRGADAILDARQALGEHRRAVRIAARLAA